MNKLLLTLLAVVFAAPSLAAGMDCRSTIGHFDGQSVSVHRAIEASDRPGWIVMNGIYDGKALPEIELTCRSTPSAVHCRGMHYGGHFEVTIGPGWMSESVTRKTGEEIARLEYTCTGALTG